MEAFEDNGRNDVAVWGEFEAKNRRRSAGWVVFWSKECRPHPVKASSVLEADLMLPLRPDPGSGLVEQINKEEALTLNTSAHVY